MTLAVPPDLLARARDQRLNGCDANTQRTFPPEPVAQQLLRLELLDEPRELVLGAGHGRDLLGATHEVSMVRAVLARSGARHRRSSMSGARC